MAALPQPAPIHPPPDLMAPTEAEIALAVREQARAAFGPGPPDPAAEPDPAEEPQP